MMEAGLPYVPYVGHLPCISQSGFVRKMLSEGRFHEPHNFGVSLMRGRSWPLFGGKDCYTMRHARVILAYVET